MQIIKEEMQSMQEADIVGDEEPKDQNQAAIDDVKELDVQRIADLIGKIDQPQEYIELVTLFLKWGNEIPGKEQILRNLLSQLPKFIQGIE